MKITKKRQAEINKGFEIMAKIEPSIILSQEDNLILISGDKFNSSSLRLNKFTKTALELIQVIALATKDLEIIRKTDLFLFNHHGY
jgi:hypothetical protein